MPLLLSVLQEGETAGASPEEVFSALQYSGTEVPLQWLRSELSYVLEMVAELAGQQDPELGAFSCQEARKAWLDRHGNLDEAVEECVRARRRKPLALACGWGGLQGHGGHFHSAFRLLGVNAARLLHKERTKQCPLLVALGALPKEEAG